jgi:poly(A) polymerase Pap1
MICKNTPAKFIVDFKRMCRTTYSLFVCCGLISPLQHYCWWNRIIANPIKYNGYTVRTWNPLPYTHPELTRNS